MISTCKLYANINVLELNKDWTFRQSECNQSVYLAEVPGCVHTDLIKNKLILDPYLHMNEKEVQWVDKKDWIYQTIFNVSGDILLKTNVELHFKGLDTYADVYLNDSLILQANNMFREWMIDCKSLLRQRGNCLRIYFKSPITQALVEKNKYGIDLPNVSEPLSSGLVESNQLTCQYLRKAPYQFGWDWGPRLVTSGIWRPVFIKAWDSAVIDNIHFVNQKISANSASLMVKLRINSTVNTMADIKLSCKNQNFEPVISKVNLVGGVNEVEIPIVIKQPKLWWCNGLGEPFLSQFKTELICNKKVLDEKNTNVGIRILKLIQEKDSIGKSFTFEINGIKVFAKGANYIPNDVFPTRVSSEIYENILSDAKDANINMLRVWGGGIYENDVFYDLCDKMGLMVWQDFMFACAMYPGDSSFLDNVRTEAIQNVERLNNHPCIALWCGNNEINTGWQCWGWKDKFTKHEQEIVWTAYDNLFHKILPEAVEKYDGQQPYWPTSPFQGFDNLLEFPQKPVENDWRSKELWEKNSGDVHSWGVWFGNAPFEFYSKVVPRFVSEYGIQSFPELETWKSVVDTSNLTIESPVMKYRQRSFVGNGLIKSYMDMYYKPQNSFDNFIYVSQVMQALCIKTAIEAHRSNMPNCMGSIFWQLNDCWQAPTWAGIDYSGRWKAMHYVVKKAFSKIVVTAIDESDNINVRIVSDSLKSISTNVQLDLYDFSGKLVFKKVIPVQVMPNTATSAIIIKPQEILGQYKPMDVVLKMSLVNKDNDLLTTNYYYFVPPKELNLTQPLIEKEISKVGENISIRLKSNVFAKNIFLSVPFEGHFSDNNVDLLPNEQVEIKFRAKKNQNIKSFEKFLTIKTLKDTY